MRELGIAFGIVLLLTLVGMLAMLPQGDVIFAGAWMIGVGFVVGVPAGLVYHFQLARTLKPRGELPKGWIWRPIELNKKLRPADRWPVLSWCYAGGAAFFVLTAGLVVFAMGLLAGFARGF